MGAGSCDPWNELVQGHPFARSSPRTWKIDLRRRESEFLLIATDQDDASRRLESCFLVGPGIMCSDLAQQFQVPSDLQLDRRWVALGNRPISHRNKRPGLHFEPLEGYTASMQRAGHDPGNS